MLPAVDVHDVHSRSPRVHDAAGLDDDSAVGDTRKKRAEAERSGTDADRRSALPP